MNHSLAGSSDLLGILVQSFTPTFMQTSITEGQRCLRTKMHCSLEHLPHVVEHHPPPTRCLFQTLLLKRLCQRDGGWPFCFPSPYPTQNYFVSFSCLFKYTWMHVKAMHSACVNFFFFLQMPQKHKRNSFQRNKEISLKDKQLSTGII